MSAADDLRAAADLLERDGWTQGVYHRAVGGRCAHCALGAVAVVTGFHRVGVPPTYLEEVAVGEVDWDYARKPDLYGTFSTPEAKRNDAAVAWVRKVIDTHLIPDWNDAPERTADEVIAALREAADEADAL